MVALSFLHQRLHVAVDRVLQFLQPLFQRLAVRIRRFLVAPGPSRRARPVAPAPTHARSAPSGLPPYAGPVPTSVPARQRPPHHPSCRAPAGSRSHSGLGRRLISSPKAAAAASARSSPASASVRSSGCRLRLLRMAISARATGFWKGLSGRENGSFVAGARLVCRVLPDKHAASPADLPTDERSGPAG